MPNRTVESPLHSKAPFANYDMVVYFGGGIFALFLAWKYIALPCGIFDFNELQDVSRETPWSIQIVLITIIGIVSYLAGHITAYMSSYFIEGMIKRLIGNVSDVVMITKEPQALHDAKLVERINENLKKNFGPFKGGLIWLFHAPLGIWYSLMVLYKRFDSLDTRLPNRMLAELEERLPIDFPGVSCIGGGQWFRWVEYFVYFNKPSSGASMYNYLVISGLMRSIAFLFICGIWAELGHFFYFYITQETLIHVGNPFKGYAAYAICLFIGAVCSLTAYTKFARRYVEEAVLGYLLEGRPNAEPNQI